MSSIRKVILYTRSDGLIESIAFLPPHVDSSSDSNQTHLSLFSPPITSDDIEAVADIDFFVGLRGADHVAAKENAIEVSKATSFWPTE